jgi:hypothetical protein
MSLAGNGSKGIEVRALKPGWEVEIESIRKILARAADTGHSN